LGFGLALLAMVLFAASTLMTKLAAPMIDLDAGVSVAAVTNVFFALAFFCVQVIWTGSPARPELVAVGFFSLAGPPTSAAGSSSRPW
jgi:hypothetical protein